MGRPIGERSDDTRTPWQVLADAIINPFSAFGPNSFRGQRRRLRQMRNAAHSTSVFPAQRGQALEDLINRKKRKR